MFGVGLAIGVVATAWWALERQESPAEGRGPAPAEVVALAHSLPPPSPVACDFAPLVPRAGEEDGRERLAGEAPRLDVAGIAQWLRTGKEAAAAGRWRDAEVAFLGACRAAERLEDRAALADARYHLARHYSHVARGAERLADARRRDLLQRAELLYGESLRAFRRIHGDEHEMTRFAALGLERVRTALGGRLPPALADAGRAEAPAHADTGAAQQAGAENAKEQEARRLAEARAKEQDAQQLAETRAKEREAQRAAQQRPSERAAATAVRPSFDCAKARSIPEKLICADAELARLDRELGELHAEAAAAAQDRRAFQRRSDQRWLDRERACRDRACLLDWYAERRAELSAQLD